ncbi:MAG: mechanosensitive ion channel [Nitrosopumilaceae archaeon]|nr:mechanosensitive ion channel [Nitrosopumilaceae archaeon]NIU00336.1 mechanosensitive ion channel [Nitrosopumilaceae archaeon]NIU86738.1 mechanosensitive ion channel [Nitrosopumilaceae archaeon]NIV65439.1 mechanosensitive ion channel [Nitrosopumilaceae archaeon]NIX60938.1 mechanosensitive ion channel [Nitrosopumilaceae archaeon]
MVEVEYAIISLVITGIAIAVIKIVDYIKFKNLVGSYKASIVMTLIIVVAEIIYLSVNFKLLSYAIETVTSLSALLIFMAFVYLNKLQNAASGLSMALGTRVKVGDRVEIQGKKGIIVQLGLTKTVIQVDGVEGMRLWVPNKLFDEKVSFLTHTEKKRTRWNQKNSFTGVNK